MRYVRTNRGDELKMQAKSRIVIPGHRDPQLGLFRSDSPTTSPIAMLLAAQIGLSMGWQGETFDVRCAFLSGQKLDGKIHLRAPKEGLPKTDTTQRVAPGQLLQILKRAYGLTEAPRLWYLESETDPHGGHWIS